MTFARGVFAFALLMLVLGLVGSSYISKALFGDVQQSSTKVLGAVSTQTATATVASTPIASNTATATPRPKALSTVPPTRTPRALSTPTVAPLQKVTSIGRPPSRHSKTQPATSRPTSVPRPTSTPITGIVTLERYWVGSQRVPRGTTLAIGYVISNGTGHTVRLLLGASIKGANSLSWARGTVNDPSHDVVAVVPPGMSTHIRYFTLPSRIHPGFYDAAWGLRNARNGRRTALVTASDALRVTR